MAKAKRKSTSGKRRKSKKSSNSQDLNLNIIGTIIFSVLLAVLLYTNSGTLGQAVSPVLPDVL